MNINLKDRVVKIYIHLNDKHRKPIGQRWLLRRGWSQDNIDLFAHLWSFLTVCVGIVIVIVLVYE